MIIFGHGLERESLFALVGANSGTSIEQSDPAEVKELG